MNTYEKVIDYLKLHKKLEYDIEFYRNKMGGLKAISYSQEEPGTSSEDMMSVYMQKIYDAEAKQKEIELFVDKNFIALDRLLIQERFINCKTLAVIGDSIGYSIQHTNRLINKAIYKYLAK